MIDYVAWLKDPAAVRIVLIEVGVKVDGLEMTRYLSTGAYVTSPTDSPANQYYDPVVTTGLKFSEQLDLTGQGGLSAGDIEIANYDGVRDDWLDDIWDNHSLKAWIGDPRWVRADFQMIFNGVVATIGSKSRDVLNLSLRDKLQRLNTPVTDAKLNNSEGNADEVFNLSFGEVHNVTPQVTNAVAMEYQVHDGAIEGCFEVRDNGKPVTATHTFGTGRFTLSRAPAGAITASVQGDKFGGTYRNTISSLVKRIVTGYGKVSDRFGSTSQLAAGSYNYLLPDFATYARASTATYIDVAGNIQTATSGTLRTADYSTGVAQTLIEDPATNYILSSAALTTGWTGTASNSSNAATYRGIAYRAIAKTLSSTSEAYASTMSNIPTGQCVTATVALRAGTTTTTMLGLYDGSNGNWGINGDVVCSVLEGPGTITGNSGALVTVTNLSASVDTLVKVTRRYTVATSGSFWLYPGTSASTTIGHSILATRVQAEYTAALTSPSTSYIPTAGAVVTRLGDVAMMFDDIDAASFAAFETANPQPVGVFADGRTNVLTLCQQLANSLDAQLVMSRLGKLRLIQLKIPGSGTPIVVMPQQMVERSLKIVSRPLVKGAVMLGFDKNWTVQADLLTSIPVAHKTLFALEWLTATATSTEVQADYKLNAAPLQTDTMLCKRTDAQTEAQRRLDLWKTPRTVFQFEGTADLLSTLELGSAITITNRRYGLQSGKTGIVISLAPNWLNGHVTVGVLV